MRLKALSTKLGHTILDQDVNPGIAIRKKTGVSAGCGFGTCGALLAGYPVGLGGIYQLRHSPTGDYSVVMRSYAPTNPRSTAQQIRRIQFMQSMIEWQELSAPEVAEWNRKASKKGRLGRWDFQKYFMRLFEPPASKMLCGLYQAGYPTKQI